MTMIVLVMISLSLWFVRLAKYIQTNKQTNINAVLNDTSQDAFDDYEYNSTCLVPPCGALPETTPKSLIITIVITAGVLLVVAGVALFSYRKHGSATRGHCDAKRNHRRAAKHRTTSN